MRSVGCSLRGACKHNVNPRAGGTKCLGSGGEGRNGDNLDRGKGSSSINRLEIFPMPRKRLELLCELVPGAFGQPCWLIRNRGCACPSQN